MEELFRRLFPAMLAICKDKQPTKRGTGRLTMKNWKSLTHAQLDHKMRSVCRWRNNNNKKKILESSAEANLEEETNYILASIQK